jgi:hypothetical protein
MNDIENITRICPINPVSPLIITRFLKSYGM